MGRLQHWLILVLLILFPACSGIGRLSPSPPELTVAVLDVGQGLAVAVITDEKQALLYDAGNSRDDAERVILPFLREHGVQQLDYLVLSHPDQDHIGGMSAVLQGIWVRTFVDPVLPTTNRAYAEVLRLVGEQRSRPLRAVRGTTFQIGTRVQARILWPKRPFLRNTSGEIADNDNSVVLLIEHPSVRIVLPGDLEFHGEEALVQREAGSLPADILVVGHHGSRTSTSMTFLSAVRPAVAVISVGAGNRYGHPHDETIQRLFAIGAQVFRTDVDGTVIVTVRKGYYTVKSERWKGSSAKGLPTRYR